MLRKYTQGVFGGSGGGFVPRYLRVGWMLAAGWLLAGWLGGWLVNWIDDWLVGWLTRDLVVRFGI